MSRKRTSVVHIDSDQAVQINELPDLKRLAGLAPRVRVLLDEAIAERKESVGKEPFTPNLAAWADCSLLRNSSS